MKTQKFLSIVMLAVGMILMSLTSEAQNGRGGQRNDNYNNQQNNQFQRGGNNGGNNGGNQYQQRGNYNNRGRNHHRNRYANMNRGRNYYSQGPTCRRGMFFRPRYNRMRRPMVSINF